MWKKGGRREDEERMKGEGKRSEKEGSEMWEWKRTECANECANRRRAVQRARRKESE